MELRHLRYFVAVAEELNYTRAAARLKTAQPSLSQQIMQLERHVGTPLLARTKRRVRLTAAGRVFYREAQAILAHADRATEMAADVARGRSRELSVGMMPAAETVILPRLMPLLAARLPNLRVALHSVGSFAEQLEGLRTHQIDLAFLWGPIDEDDLVVEPLYTEQFVVALPATHALAKATRVAIHELADVPRILPAGRSSPLHNALAALTAAGQARLRPTQDADNVLGHLNMVRAGLGFAVLPEYVRAILPAGVVAVPLSADPTPTIAVVLAHLKDGQLPVVENFKKAVREAMGLAGQRPVKRGGRLSKKAARASR